MKLNASQLIEMAPEVFALVSGDQNVAAGRPWPPNQAPAGATVFISSKEQLDIAVKNQAGLLIIDQKLLKTLGTEIFPQNFKTPILKVPSIPLAMSFVNRHFEQKHSSKTGQIDQTAKIHPSAKISASAFIGAYCVIEEGASIGDDCKIQSHCVIEAFAFIGSSSLIHSFVKIGHHCQIGQHCEIHSHTAIGTDGFGFHKNKNSSISKISQIGIVVIEDFVEMGSHCCADRATLFETRIGESSKLDNFCHIGHNVQIGRRALITARFTIAGSSIIGDDFMCGGESSVTDHVTITSNVTLGGRSGVTKDILTPGAYVGFPVEPLKEGLRTLSNLSQITDLRKRLAELERQLTPTKGNANEPR